MMCELNTWEDEMFIKFEANPCTDNPTPPCQSKLVVRIFSPNFNPLTNYNDIAQLFIVLGFTDPLKIM